MKCLIGKEGFELGHRTPNSHFPTLQELQGEKGAKCFYCKSRNMLQRKSHTFSFSGTEKQAGFGVTLEIGLECIHSPRHASSVTGGLTEGSGHQRTQ